VARQWGLKAWDEEGTTFGAVTAVSVGVSHDTVVLTTSRQALAHAHRPGSWQPANRCQLLVMAALPHCDLDPVQALLDRTHRGPAYLGDLGVTYQA
jgi:hypothetical protein